MPRLLTLSLSKGEGRRARLVMRIFDPEYYSPRPPSNSCFRRVARSRAAGVALAFHVPGRIGFATDSRFIDDRM